MSKYSYFSEKQALEDQFHLLSQNYGDQMVEYYLANGFDDLALALRFGSPFMSVIVSHLLDR